MRCNTLRRLPSTVFSLVFCVTGFYEVRQARAAEGGPLVIIGIDGLTFDVLEPLVQTGRLPNFRRLIENGARAVLRSEKPMRSPALWTTIATGQPRAAHQIYDFVTGSAYWPRDQRADKQLLVTSDMRRSQALWELTSRVQRRSLVVGWLNTWPAEPLHGVMVAPYVALGTRRQTTIKGKIYDNIERQTYPETLFAQVKPLVTRADAVSADRVAALVDLPPKNSPLWTQVPRLERYLYTIRWSIAGALTNIGIIEHQLARGDFALVMTYLDGADTLGHRFWVFRQPTPMVAARLKAHGIDPGLAPLLKRHFGRVVDNYYTFADQLVGRVAAAAGEGATLMIISDHGWGDLRDRVKAPHEHVPFDGEHRLDGLFVAAGPHVQQGRFADLTLYDIAPTALYLLGIQPPPEMPGKVARNLVDDCLAHGQRPVAAETRPNPEAPVDPNAPFKEAELERLRSLGYVQ